MRETLRNTTSEPLSPALDPSEPEIREIRDLLRGLRFGSVTIVVHDGAIVQIDRTEKRRLRESRRRETD